MWVEMPPHFLICMIISTFLILPYTSLEGSDSLTAYLCDLRYFDALCHSDETSGGSEDE